MTTTARDRADASEARLRVGSWLMGVAAAGFVAYAAVFLILSFTSGSLELGIGREQVDVGREEIRAFSPSLSHYLQHLHLAAAGFIAAIGAAVLFLVIFGVRRGAMWAWAGAVTATVISLGISLPAHYPYGFDTLAHLGPVYVATVIFAAGAVVALRGLQAKRRAPGDPRRGEPRRSDGGR